jgi:Fusaric acid resistance protein-like
MKADMTPDVPVIPLRGALVVGPPSWEKAPDPGKVAKRPTTDDLLGGLWAVIATVFVCRFSHHQSTAAAVSGVAATLVSFALSLIYLLFLPFHLWALAALIGASALAAALIGRPGEAITTGIIHSRTYLAGQSGRAPADVEAAIRVRRWPADISAARFSAQVGPRPGRK